MQRKLREDGHVMTSYMTSLLTVIFKMSTEKCQDFIKLYYEHRSLCPGDRGMTKLQVSRVVERFKQHERVLDQRHNNQGLP